MKVRSFDAWICTGAINEIAGQRRVPSTRNAMPVIARSEATKQSTYRQPYLCPGLLRFARNDGLVLSPRRGALHRRLTGGIRSPQFHTGIRIVGIDAEFAAFEQRLQPAIAEFPGRRAAMEAGREFQQEPI